MGSGSSVPQDELSRLSNDPVYGPKIRDIFEMLDTDSSGSLDCGEIESYLYRTVEYEEEHLDDDGEEEVAIRTKREATLRFDELDLNGDGKITLEEFCNAIDGAVEMQREQRLQKGELSNHRKLREEIDQAFRVLDKATKEKSAAGAARQVAQYLELVVKDQRATAQKRAAAQRQAELDVFPTPECVRRWAVGLHGSLLRKQRARDMHTAVNWLQTALPLAGVSGAVNVAIQALLANPDFTLNLSLELLQELRDRAADAVLNTLSRSSELQDVMSIEQFVDDKAKAIARGTDASGIRISIPQSQLSRLGRLDISCTSLQEGGALSRAVNAPVPSPTEHHRTAAGAIATHVRDEQAESEPATAEVRAHESEGAPSNDGERALDCADNNHPELLGQLLCLQVPQRGMEPDDVVHDDANPRTGEPLQVGHPPRLAGGGLQSSGLLARLVNGEDRCAELHAA